MIPTFFHTEKLVHICTADHRRPLDLDLGLQDSQRLTLPRPHRQDGRNQHQQADPAWAAGRAPSGRRRETGMRMTFRPKKPAALRRALGTDVTSNRNSKVKGPVGGSSDPLSI